MTKKKPKKGNIKRKYKRKMTDAQLKKAHKLAKKLEKKKVTDTPYALATWMVQKGYKVNPDKVKRATLDLNINPKMDMVGQPTEIRYRGRDGKNYKHKFGGEGKVLLAPKKGHELLIADLDKDLTFDKTRGIVG